MPSEKEKRQRIEANEDAGTKRRMDMAQGRRSECKRPDVIRSPTWMLNSQRGNSFEFATFLVSLLLGQGYNAFVVSGYASREQTMYDMSMNPCPYMPKSEELSTVSETPKVSKYQLKPPPEFRSKLLMEIEEEEVQRQQEEEQQQEEKRRKLILEQERLPPDEYWGYRVHAWVVVLPEAGGARRQEVLEPFFIEPSSGQCYSVNNHQTNLLYHGVESIWNDRNYWVNMQMCTEACININWDLTDNRHWEHLLPGEPHTMHSVEETKADEDLNIQQDKHLDMPMSYVEQIDIHTLDYERRFPNGRKIMYFKKVKVELCAPYIQMDGLIEKITIYDDYKWQFPTRVYEKYINRGDKLKESTHYLDTGLVVDRYNRGRPDAVKEHQYMSTDNDTLEEKRTLEFYDVVRGDGLSKIEIHPSYLIQYYVGRKDLLYYRYVEFSSEKKSKSRQGIHYRDVSKIIEKFNRNKNIPVEKDIAIREFCIKDNKIELMYHYKDYNITRATRTFIKPTDRGDELVFDPDMTYGYNPNPEAVEEKPLDLYNLLERQLKDEQQSLVYVQDAERMVNEFLKLRKSEYGIPKLSVSIFDKNRNEEAKAEMIAKEEALHAQSLRQVEEEVDYLAPYIARRGNPDKLTKSEALEISQECLDDLKQMLVNRANKIWCQLQASRRKFEQLQNQLEQVDDLSKEEEEKLIEETNNVNSEMQTLDVRLKRHCALASVRYQSMVKKLKEHWRLDSLAE
ncbi:dynein regulatory complex subunit 7-like [Chelonus insularis]|uniref:dynein regulatory complex subunit 7-like n=1 Tax=Chelonus insularis TaxID=460826 RepID=UPI00158AC0C8|nr:dynein regulatory complex subunit 7-like [Chelonus insularis]